MLLTSLHMQNKGLSLRVLFYWNYSQARYLNLRLLGEATALTHFTSLVVKCPKKVNFRRSYVFAQTVPFASSSIKSSCTHLSNRKLRSGGSPHLAVEKLWVSNSAAVCCLSVTRTASQQDIGYIGRVHEQCSLHKYAVRHPIDFLLNLSMLSFVN
jgi:hypothetical protein